MSTRANIIVSDAYNTLFVYRHSDGYPEGALPKIAEFVGHIKPGGPIRDNVGQAAGWLIVIGHHEYAKYGSTYLDQKPGDWKVGSMEPTVGLHADIEYAYHIDLNTKIVTVYEVAGCVSPDWDSRDGLKVVTAYPFAYLVEQEAATA